MSDVLITHCSVTAHSLATGGGMGVQMYSDGGMRNGLPAERLFAQQVLLTRVTISHCVAISTTSGAAGGSMYVNGVWSGWSPEFGGTLAYGALQVVITDSYFQNGSAIGYGDNGGNFGGGSGGGYGGSDGGGGGACGSIPGTCGG